MTDDYVVQSLTTGVIGTEPVFRVRQLKPDGTTIEHIMPQSIIAIRAGEYGLDPLLDRTTILDMIFHEPHMDPIPEEQLSRDAVGKPRQSGDALHIYNAPTIEDAKNAQLARIAAAKKNNVNVVWSGNPNPGNAATKTLQTSVDPLAGMISFVTDPAVVEHHKQRVFNARGRVGLETLPPKPLMRSGPPDPAFARRNAEIQKELNK